MFSVQWKTENRGSLSERADGRHNKYCGWNKEDSIDCKMIK